MKFLGEKLNFNPFCPELETEIIEIEINILIEIKNDIIFIFTLLCSDSERFHLFKAPKRGVTCENKEFCYFPLLFHWDDKG